MERLCLNYKNTLKEIKKYQQFVLSNSLLRALDDDSNFLQWVNSIPSEVIQKYSYWLYGERMGAVQKEEYIGNDVTLASILWLGKYKNDMNAPFEEEELVGQFVIIETLLSLLAADISFQSQSGGISPMKIRIKYPHTWDHNCIFIDSYMKCEPAPGIPVGDIVSDTVQSSLSLGECCMILEQKMLEHK